MFRAIVRAYQGYSRGVDRLVLTVGGNVYLATGFVSLILLSWGLVLGWPAYVALWEGRGWNGLVYVQARNSAYLTTAGSYAIFPSILVLIALLVPLVVLAHEKEWWFFAPKQPQHPKKSTPRRSGKGLSYRKTLWDRFCRGMSGDSRSKKWTGTLCWDVIVTMTLFVIFSGGPLFPAWRATPVLLSHRDWNQTVNISWSYPQILVPVWFAFLLSFGTILLFAIALLTWPSSMAKRIRGYLIGVVTRLFGRQSAQ